MGLFSKFPYTNFQQLNLDWILDKIAYIEDKLSKTYDIPVCSKTRFGRVKVGDNITVNEGEISTPIASEHKLGVVRVGDNLIIDETGRLSAVGSEVTPGDNVTVTPILNEGEQIAKVQVNENLYTLYAPTPEPAPAPGDNVTVTPILNEGEQIAKVQVNENLYTLYAPTPEPPKLTNSYAPYIDKYPTAETKVYIDYANGDDNTGDGTINKPFKRLSTFFNVYMRDKERQNHTYRVIIKAFNGNYTLDAGGSSDEPLLIDYNLIIEFENYTSTTSNISTLNFNHVAISGSLKFGSTKSTVTLGDNMAHKLIFSNITVLSTGSFIISKNDFNLHADSSLENITNYGTICFGFPVTYSSSSMENSSYITLTLRDYYINLQPGSKFYCNNITLKRLDGSTTMPLFYSFSNKVLPAPLLVLNHFYTELSQYQLLSGNAIILANDIASGYTFTNHVTYTLL